MNTQQEEASSSSSPSSSTLLNMNPYTTTIEASTPCEAYEKDGFCAKGSTCKFKHESALENINLLEFLFQFETIIPRATSKKVSRKINSISSSEQDNNNTVQSPSTLEKPLIRKSKKTKIEKKTSLGSVNNNGVTNNSSSSITSIVEEPYEVPKEYLDINFEKPIIPFNFSFHTPTFHRQSILQELIELNMKSTNNRKKAIVQAFKKGKIVIFLNS